MLDYIFCNLMYYLTTQRGCLIWRKKKENAIFTSPWKFVLFHGYSCLLPSVLFYFFTQTLFYLGCPFVSFFQSLYLRYCICISSSLLAIVLYSVFLVFLCLSLWSFLVTFASLTVSFLGPFVVAKRSYYVSCPSVCGISAVLWECKQTWTDSW